MINTEEKYPLLNQLTTELGELIDQAEQIPYKPGDTNCSDHLESLSEALSWALGRVEQVDSSKKLVKIRK